MMSMITLFYCVVLATLREITAQIPGACKTQAKTCSKEMCVVQMTVFTNERIKSVQWFHDKEEIQMHDQYTGSMNESMLYCSGNIICVRSVLELIIKPFEAKHYGKYSGSVTTRNQTEIQCETKSPLKLAEQMSTGQADQSGVVTVKTSYIFIGIGVVAGCGVLIVILIVTVIHLVRRNKNVKVTSPSHRLDIPNNPPHKLSADHTYASISSDVFRYEDLSGRRGTKDGYDFPMVPLIKEDTNDYVNQSKEDGLTVPSELEDDISDFSITMDSAFSSSSVSLVVDDAALNNPQYIGGSFHKKNTGLHFNNGEYQTTQETDGLRQGEYQTTQETDALRRGEYQTTQETDALRRDDESTRKTMPSDYQNIKNARRLT